MIRLGLNYGVGRLIPALLAALMVLAATPAEGQLADSAAAAWVRGDTDTAVQLYERQLTRDPSDVIALHRLALAKAWARDFDGSMSLFGRLIELDPENAQARVHRANALAWAGRHDQAVEGYRQVLAADPADVEARLGLARVLAWSGRMRESEDEFRGVLVRDPSNLEARKGLARTAGWSGRLREGERRWREVLTSQPEDVDALVGLAATLRWQGRTGAAIDVLDRAERLAPDNADVETQRRWLDAAAGPAVSPSFLYESDSDGNRSETFRVTGRWLMTESVGLRLVADSRDLDETAGSGLERSTRSADLLLSVGLGSGWTVSGGGGVRVGTQDTQETLGLWRAGLSSPAYLPVTASVAVSRTAFDYTALLADRNVAVEEVAVVLGSSTAANRLRAGLRGGFARFDAAEDNHRWLAGAHVTYRLLPVFSIGLNARTFGFSDDVDEGYWDPSLYGIVEAPLTISLEGDHLFGSVEVAPGYQTIEHAMIDVDNSALRAGGRVGLRLGPGRQLGVSAVTANSGLQRVSPVPEADYEYRAVSIFLEWSLR
jgi:tetratricopeptide (TPR) repeat protein